MTLLLNYAHPLTAEQQAQLATLLAAPPEIRNLGTTIDRRRPLADIALELADAAGLTPEEWQTLPLLLNPPALAPVALALMAELHGRCGYFLPILNIRPVDGALPPRFEIAELLNLQVIRGQARTRRAHQTP